MKALRLPILKASQLKYLAFLTGISSSGTKATIESALLRSLSQPPKLIPQDGEDSEAYRKLVSIDMGIRNLAYCEVQFPLRGSLPLKVTQWERMDLLDTAASNVQGLQSLPPADEDVKATSKESTFRRAKSKSKGAIKALVDKEAFTPPSMARTAHGIIGQMLALDPDVILIERQRFRSGGAAAVQEWTVRVNMLESMLWACLETHRNYHLSQRFPETYAISPRRVADFWVPGSDIPLRPPADLFSLDFKVDLLSQTAVPGRNKVEKRDKIDVARSWILSDSDVDIEFTGDDTASLTDAFSREKSKRARLAGGKLDDLADCLLQAVAYVRWEENKQAIRQTLLMDEPA